MEHKEFSPAEKITIGIADFLLKKHRKKLLKIAKVDVLYDMIDSENGIVIVRLRYKKVKITYELKINAFLDAYGIVKGGIIESENTIIARSRFKYKKIDNTTIRTSSVNISTEQRIWPVCCYWQDVVQLNYFQIGLFDMLYGELSKRVKKALGKK